MKIKKFPQSHLVITNNQGKKLIIDPGYLTFQKGFKVENFQGADLYLITHQHADHLGPETIKQVVGESPVYANEDVVNKLKEAGINHATRVKDRQEFESKGFKITPVDLPHFEKPGVNMPPNTGFLIDGIFFHPGDGWKLTGINSKNAAIPIGGPPDGDIGINQGLSLAKSLQAKIVIPIHYDAYPANPSDFTPLAENEGIKVITLSHGEETEIS